MEMFIYISFWLAVQILIGVYYTVKIIKEEDVESSNKLTFISLIKCILLLLLIPISVVMCAVTSLMMRKILSMHKSYNFRFMDSGKYKESNSKEAIIQMDEMFKETQELIKSMSSLIERDINLNPGAGKTINKS